MMIGLWILAKQQWRNSPADWITISQLLMGLRDGIQSGKTSVSMGTELRFVDLEWRRRMPDGSLYEARVTVDLADAAVDRCPAEFARNVAAGWQFEFELKRANDIREERGPRYHRLQN